MAFRTGAIQEFPSGRKWDRDEFAAQVRNRAARLRELAVVPGDRVMLLADNTLEFFAELLAVWICGAAAAPVDATLSVPELENLERTAEPRLVVVTGNRAPDAKFQAPLLFAQEPAAPSLDPSPPSLLHLDQPALILFTSGSTGQPKGVLHTHRSLLARWHSLRQSLGVETYQRTLCLLPVYFGHGLICNCLFPLLSGCDLLLGPAFSPAVLTQLGRWVDDHRITAMSSVPALWRLALRLSPSPTGTTLRRIHCGSAPLSADLWNRISEWAGGVEVVNTYGITETASWLAGSLGAGEPIDGLIGQGWCSDVRVLQTDHSVPPIVHEAECAAGETGYIWVHTPALMNGYFRRDELTARAVIGGWFYTGDMGLRDDRGRVILGGRAVDEINKGGLKIQPQDVENVAAAFEHVRDACAFAAPDELLGQTVAIALAMNGDEPEKLAALHDWMQSRLSRHKMPSKWYILESLPRTSRGKINRPTIAELCAARQPDDPRGKR